MQPVNPSQKLSELRKDLEVYKGPEEWDGSPTYNIYDPIRDKYLKISWIEMQIFQMLEPGMTIEELKRKVERHSTLEVTNEEVAHFFKLASHHHLLLERSTSDQIEEERQKVEHSWWKWLMYHYLYIRFPLFAPDAFLEKTLPYVTFLVSPLAWCVYAVVTLLGGFVLISRFEEYLYTFPYFFNFQGVMFYTFSVLIVKVIHELAHAYTAKYYGVKVKTIGAALLVFIPVFFTDVTHGWQLKSRGQRFAISAAGLFAECIVAGMATLGWAVSDPGLAKSIFFVVSSITLITSFLFNMNPALKFDGYYILSDLWGIDNLQSRAFEYTRWRMREWFLGWKTPPPEGEMPRWRGPGLVIYTIYTWIYRLFIFVAISLLIYYKFTKLLGVALMVLTAYLIFVLPIKMEWERGKVLKKYFVPNMRYYTTVTLAFLFLTWFLFPLPHAQTFVGITEAIEEQVAYVPHSSRVKEIMVERGESVKKGDLLIQFHSEELDSKHAQNKVDVATIQREIDVLTHSKDPSYKALIPRKYEELLTAEEKLKSVDTQVKNLSIYAEIDGIVNMWDDHLWKGQSLMRDAVIGKVYNPQTIEVQGYLPEQYLDRISVGAKASFILQGSLEELTGTITSISPVGSKYLHHVQLASIYGGDIAVTQDEEKRLVFADSYYLVTMRVDPDQQKVNFGEIGWFKVRGPWRSLFIDTIGKWAALFWRESGL